MSLEIYIFIFILRKPTARGGSGQGVWEEGSLAVGMTAAFSAVPFGSNKYGHMPSKFPLNVQPLAMRYFYSFLFNIPWEWSFAFTGYYQETKATKHILIVQAICLFLSDNRENL